ncbi:MAG: guanylate kinase [Pelagibacteraceae bacterium TMED216]|nr:MAG: guanylate kinase [Pelagibacteraceae bacterium TMED216]|tara:strand:+ start:102 stop:698 length:597 start_codon:yes stop_codon:yes gene_type:complete
MTNTGECVLLILSSPSGAGKTSLSKKIQKEIKNFEISISHTTRKPRKDEINGKDYHFISKDDFSKKIKNNDFYEYAKIYDNYYGTSKDSVNTLLKQNKNIIFDIDWQGTQQLVKFSNLKFLKIFLLPPNKSELEKRLISRNKDSNTSLLKRLKAYEEDKLHWKEYDIVLVNNDLEICYSQLKKIITNYSDKSQLPSFS